MYSSYYSLALELLRKYIRANISPSLDEKSSSPAHVQWSAPPYTVTVTEIAAATTLVNFVEGNQAKAITIDWTAFDAELPIKEISNDLEQSFSSFMDSKLFGGEKSRLKEQTNQERGPQLKSSTPRDEPSLRVRQSDQPRLLRPPDMPDFEDEYEIHLRQSASSTAMPIIGDRDLNPSGIGRHPEVKPYLDPLRADNDGGMYPSANHPIFGSRTGNTSRLGVPPGARFDDPYGEDNLEDMGLGLPGNLRRGGGPGGHGFGPLGFGPGGRGGPTGGSGGFNPGGFGGF